MQTSVLAVTRLSHLLNLPQFLITRFFSPTRLLSTLVISGAKSYTLLFIINMFHYEVYSSTFVKYYHVSN